MQDTISDVVSVNRVFLLMARRAASSASGEVITGLSRQVLDRLSKLSLEQIEELANAVGASLISLRLSESELDRLLALRMERKKAYALTVLASEGR